MKRISSLRSNLRSAKKLLYFVHDISPVPLCKMKLDAPCEEGRWFVCFVKYFSDTGHYIGTYIKTYNLNYVFCSYNYTIFS